MMRKLVVCNAMLLDSYYAAPGKNGMPLFDYVLVRYEAGRRGA